MCIRDRSIPLPSDIFSRNTRTPHNQPVAPRRSARLSHLTPEHMSLPFQDPTSKRTRSEHKSLVVHTMTKTPPPRVSNGDTPEHFTVILDSGATAHMFNTIAYFITYTPCTSTDIHTGFALLTVPRFQSSVSGHYPAITQ